MADLQMGSAGVVVPEPAVGVVPVQKYQNSVGDRSKKTLWSLLLNRCKEKGNT